MKLPFSRISVIAPSGRYVKPVYVDAKHEKNLTPSPRKNRKNNEGEIFSKTSFRIKTQLPLGLRKIMSQ